MIESNTTATALNWVGRLASIGTFLFIGTFFVGELTGGDGQAPTAAEWLGVLFFPGGLLTGLALAWRNRMAGGVVAVLSVAAFYIWNYSRSGAWPSGPWILILASPAIAFALSAVVDGPHRSNPDAHNEDNTRAVA